MLYNILLGALLASVVTSTYLVGLAIAAQRRTRTTITPYIHSPNRKEVTRLEWGMILAAVISIILAALTQSPLIWH